MTNMEATKSRNGMFRRRGGPEAIERVDAALQDMGATPMMPDNEQTDPAPSAPAIAEERAQQLLTNISSQTLGELRDLRDQLDDLMRDMNERRDMIREAIRSHAEFAASAIAAKSIISESIAKMRVEFDRSATPLPPVHKV